MIAILPSCGLVTSALKVPGSILQMAGRTAGISSLTDTKPQPEQDLEMPKAEEKTSSATDSAE